MIAFDYGRQRWADGREARETRIMQLREELVLLCSDRGAEYARFCGFERGASIEACRAELAELTGGAK